MSGRSAIGRAVRVVATGGLILGVWWLDRRRSRHDRARYQRRLHRWEQESNRLRLEISALRELEAEVSVLRRRLAEATEIGRVERERSEELASRLAGAEAESARLERYEQGLQQARQEIDRLAGRLDAVTIRERKARRELTAQSGMALRSARREEASRVRAAGAEALVARRDETIRALEKQLERETRRNCEARRQAVEGNGARAIDHSG